MAPRPCFLCAVTDTLSTYIDAGLPSGIYYYVIASADASDVESGYSNRVQVVIPVASLETHP